MAAHRNTTPRAASIRNCDEAEGREGLANHLASNTALSLEEAKAILTAAPTESHATRILRMQEQATGIKHAARAGRG